MGRIFDIDSPVMRFLSRVADLMILNVLMALCCIPIITIGAGFTGLHYVLLKIVRNEEGYIARGFFKSFKENFRQATVIWLIVLVFIGVFVGDWLIFYFSGLKFPKALMVFLLALFLMVCMVICYVFPMLSRFENTVFNTLKNSLFMAILSFPKTLLMLAVHAAPAVLLYFAPRSFPFVLLFGFSVPAYISAMLYSGTFRRFEPQEEPLTDAFSIDMEGYETAGAMTGTAMKEDGGDSGEGEEN